jgi:CSLREA domain-containing protein
MSARSVRLFTVALLAIIFFLVGGTPTVSHAAGITIHVTTTDDELNADGDCSLREAIQSAAARTRSFSRKTPYTPLQSAASAKTQV